MSLIPMMPAPGLFVTLGVYRSASTWVANVAAEILRLEGPVRIIVADTAAAIARQTSSCSDAFVVKTHRPDATLRLLIHAARLPVIISVRDPCDCVASLIAQFLESFETANRSVIASCDAVLDMLAYCAPLILRYEGPSARDAATVAEIAAHLGVAIDAAEARSIAARFAPAEVKRFIDGLTAAGAFGRNPQPYYAHAATQWHPDHLGTGRVGAQHDVLTSAQIEIVRQAARALCEQFAYRAPAMALAEAS